jgi:hypothetical protein
VEINLDVLGALVLDGVGGHVDGADVVAVDQRRAARRSMKLEEQLSEPCGLGNAVGHNTILSFGAGAGHRVLPLRGPGHQIVSKEHGVTRGGTPGVGAVGPISIGVDNQVTVGRGCKRRPRSNVPRT